MKKGVNLKLITTQMVSTVFSPGNLLHDLLSHFYQKIGFCCASISAVHYPNYLYLVSNDCSYYKEQDDTCLVSIA